MKTKLCVQIVIPFIVVLLLVGCTSAPPVQRAVLSNHPNSSTIPEWYILGSVTGYGIDTHLVGTGEGATLEDAVATAQAMIGGQLKVSVESTVESFRKETSIDGEINFFETFSERSSITVSETLKGSRIVKQEQVDGTYYVYAALHIQSYLAQLLMDLSELNQQTNNQLSEARRSIHQGLIFVAMEHYRNAYDLLVEYYTKRSYVEALAPNMTPRGTMGASEVVSEIRSTLGALQLSVLSGNNQEAPLGVELEKPIEFQVLYQSNSGKLVPVHRIPITLRAENKSSIGRNATDTKGVASFWVQAIPSHRDSGSVIATIDMYAIMGEFSSSVGRPEAIAQYRIAKPAEKQRVALTLSNFNGDRMGNLERTVSQNLTQLGYTISEEESEWLLQGKCFVTSQQELSSYQGTQYIATVEMELMVVSRNSGEIAVSKILESSGMSAVDHSEAINMACARIRIDKKILSDLASGLGR